MQVTHIQTRPLRSVKPHARAETWLRGLSTAGLIKVEGDAEGPAAAMQRLYSLCWALADIEDNIERRQVSTTRTYLAPVGLVFGLVMLYLLIFQVALQQDSYTDRLWTFGLPWMILGLLCLIGVIGIRVTNRSMKMEQARELSQATQMRDSTIAELLAVRDEILRQPFAVLADGRILAYVPDLEWLRSVLPVVPPAEQQLRQAIQSAMELLEQSVDALAQGRPQDAPCATLRIELGDLHQRCVAAQINGIPPLPDTISG